MEAPPPPPPAAPPKKKPPQSTQPETAEDGQTLFDDELDRLLPVGTVASVMRAAIPPEAKIGRDAREAAQDCASEFVAFVASEASDACAAAGSASASESAQIWTRDHPSPSLMDTSRVDGVPSRF